MSYAAIMQIAGGNRVAMYQPCATLAEAEAHIAAHIADYPDAFAVQSPQGDVADWVIDPVAKTATYVAPPVPIPSAVTPLQARKALNAAGLRSAVEAAIAAADQDARDAWEYATEIRRDNALIASMAVSLGLTSAQIDDLFRSAATL